MSTRGPSPSPSPSRGCENSRAIELRSSGFYEWHEPLNPVPALGVETARLGEVLVYYHEKSFRGLFGSPSFGFQQTNLEA